MDDFNDFFNKKEYERAYEVGLGLIGSFWGDSCFVKNFISCAMFAKKSKSALKLINKITSENKAKPLLNKLAAGLAYNIKDEPENRRHSLIFSSKKPLWKKIEYKNAKIKVVVLYAAASGAYRYRARKKDFLFGGNCNFSGFLAENINVYCVWSDDFEAAVKTIESLGDVDIIYNSITEPEKCRDALNSAARICDYFEKKGLHVINKPKNVFLTERSYQKSQLDGMDYIWYPKNIKILNVKGSIKEIVKKNIAENGLSYPIIVRLAGYSAGNYMQLIDESSSFDFSGFDRVVSDSNPKDIYLIEYVDVSFKIKNDSAFYPKYRAILIGEKLYPVHLRVAMEYAVFHKNSKVCMDENPWLIKLDEKYCAEPTEVVNSKIWKDIEGMLKKTGLDYVGIDFSIAKDSDGKEKAVVFETSAGMRCWLDREDTYEHVRAAWEKIIHAFCRLLCERSEVAVWHFQLPRKI